MQRYRTATIKSDRDDDQKRSKAIESDDDRHGDGFAQWLALARCTAAAYWINCINCINYTTASHRYRFKRIGEEGAEIRRIRSTCLGVRSKSSFDEEHALTTFLDKV
jgi:hypothetical protein